MNGARIQSMVPEVLPHPGIAASTGSDRSIGAILVDSGRLSTDNAERILRVQKEQGKLFGDAAIELGLLTQDDIRFALSNQFQYPYLGAADDSLSHELIAAYQPFSPAVEQLRALRSQLMLRWFDSATERNTLAIVSPGAREGRSFIAANLAVVFSQLGERVLLIDADMRRPRQHALFKLGNHAGLSAILAGRAGTEAVVRVAPLLGLSVLPAGSLPPNPQELLGRPAFAGLLHALSAEFDIIIVDTPAAREFADAQTVAVRAGAALLLAQQNRTSAAALTQLTRTLQQSGATLVGSVLNDV
jgi:chain length determinant protein tyrosine kinase EpsG